MILKNIAIAATLLVTTFAVTAPAYATKAVTSPYVTKGRATVELRTGYDVMEDSSDDTSRARVLTSYGVTDFWDSRVAGTWSKVDGEDATTDAVAWENKFQLTPKDAYWVDLGIRLDYSKLTNTGVDEVLARLLAAKKIGSFSNIANFSFGRQVGEDSSNDVGFDVAYSIAYDLSPTYALAVEYYGDFDDFDNTYSEQNHQIGPVIYGTHGAVKYQAGVLAGISESAPEAAFKANISYSFDFLK